MLNKWIHFIEMGAPISKSDSNTLGEERKKILMLWKKEFEISEKAGNKDQRKIVHQKQKWSPNKLVDRTQNGAIFAIWATNFNQRKKRKQRCLVIPILVRSPKNVG